MKSDLNLLQIDEAVDVTSRHVTSRPRTLLRIDVVDVVSDTSSLTLWTRPLVMSIFLRLRLENYHVHRILISKTDKFKSAFRLLLTNPGRKLWPILVLLYFFKSNKLFKLLFKDHKSLN